MSPETLRPEPGLSVLEDLWNRDRLKPDSYPQLIRTLQRERNAFRQTTKASVEGFKEHEQEVLRLRTLVVELSEALRMAVDELKKIRDMARGS